MPLFDVFRSKPFTPAPKLAGIDPIERKIKDIDFEFTSLKFFRTVPKTLEFGTLEEIMTDSFQYYNMPVDFKSWYQFFLEFGVFISSLSRVITSNDIYVIKRKRFIPRVSKVRQIEEANQLSIPILQTMEQFRSNVKKINSLRELASLISTYDWKITEDFIEQINETFQRMNRSIVGKNVNGKFTTLDEIVKIEFRRLLETKITDKHIQKIINGSLNGQVLGIVSDQKIDKQNVKVIKLNALYSVILNKFIETVSLHFLEIPLVVYHLAHVPVDFNYYSKEMTVELITKQSPQQLFGKSKIHVILPSEDIDEKVFAKDYFRLLQIRSGFIYHKELENDLNNYLQGLVSNQSVIKEQEGLQTKFYELYIQNKNKILQEIAKRFRLIDQNNKLTQFGKMFLDTKAKNLMFFSVYELNMEYGSDLAIFEDLFSKAVMSLSQEVKTKLGERIRWEYFENIFGVEKEMTEDIKQEQKIKDIYVTPMDLILFIVNVYGDPVILSYMLGVLKSLSGVGFLIKKVQILVQLINDIKERLQQLISDISIRIETVEAGQELKTKVGLTIEKLILKVKSQHEELWNELYKFTPSFLQDLVRMYRDKYQIQRSSFGIKEIFDQIINILQGLNEYISDIIQQAMDNVTRYNKPQEIKIPDIDSIKVVLRGSRMENLNLIKLLFKEKKYVEIR